MNAGLFLDGLLGDERRKTGWMRAEAAGDPGPWRQQALLGRDRWDADALRDIVRDYAIEHLADDDAVLVIDETGFPQAGQGVVRGGAAIHWFGGENHQLPDRRVCRLRVAPWPCLHRSRAVFAEELDRRSGTPEGRVRAGRSRLRDQAADSRPEMIERAIAAARAVPLGCGRYRLRRRRYRAGSTPGRQRLCARRQFRTLVWILGQAATGRSAPPRRSPRRCDHPTGGACRPGPEPKDRGCMTGATSNWPISRRRIQR